MTTRTPHEMAVEALKWLESVKCVGITGIVFHAKTPEQAKSFYRSQLYGFISALITMPVLCWIFLKV